MTLRRGLAALVLTGGLVGVLTAPSGAATTDPAATGAATAPDPAATTAPPAAPTTPAPTPAPPAPTTPPAPPPTPTSVPSTAPSSAPPPSTKPTPATPLPRTPAPPAPSPSSAPSSSPSSSPSSPPTQTPASGQGGSEGDNGGGGTAPSDLKAQQDAIDALNRRIAAAQSDVDRAQAELQRAAMVAGQALETYSEAVKALQAAQVEDQRQTDLLTQAQLALSTNRQLLGRWVRQAYADGADVTGDLGVVSLLGAGSTDDVGVARQYLRRVGDSRSRTVTALEQAATVQSQAAARAQAAAEAAAAATTTAQTAKNAADAAVAQQRDVLGRLEQVLARTTQTASTQRAQLESARADFQAALRLSAGSRDGGNSVTGQVGSCTGGSVENYPNGQIPLSALCPLAADPRHHLRADAAYAFDRLSKAYTARFGSPPCITDSYRTLAEQIRLYATKPNLAARPGTSNHGWGTALDLCGGIQNFGTTQHEWMFLNAPLYGWFHPAWAQPGGSRPEPWHFEFGG